jgi:hypothetical protein
MRFHCLCRQTSATLRAEDDTALDVGTLVEVNWQNGEAYVGTVARARRNKTYDAQCANGQQVTQVPREFVTPMNPRCHP